MELVNALTEDIEVTNKFLIEDHATDRASRVSEIYDDIVYKTQSRKHIARPSKSIEHFPKENE